MNSYHFSTKILVCFATKKKRYSIILSYRFRRNSQRFYRGYLGFHVATDLTFLTLLRGSRLTLLWLFWYTGKRPVFPDCFHRFSSIFCEVNGISRTRFLIFAIWWDSQRGKSKSTLNQRRATEPQIDRRQTASASDRKLLSFRLIQRNFKWFSGRSTDHGTSLVDILESWNSVRNEFHS